MKSNYLQKLLAGRTETSTIVGIRPAVELENRYGLEDITQWLGSRVRENDKVMLEIPEYPLGDLFYSQVNVPDGQYLAELCDFLHRRGCAIVPGEDPNRCGIDWSYHQGHVRDDTAFIPRMTGIKPRFFLVGANHLDYLKVKMPEFDYLNMVDEETGMPLSPRINVNLAEKI